MAIVFITHDLGIVRRLASRVYVMRRGEVVEHGETAAIFGEYKVHVISGNQVISEV